MKISVVKSKITDMRGKKSSQKQLLENENLIKKEKHEYRKI